MRTLANILLVFLLASCQKEIPLYADKDPKTGQTPTPVQEPEPQPEPKDTVYRAEPDQEMNIGEFAPMLWEKSQYQITEFYSIKENLWDEFPSWAKDDIYTFQEFGKSWIFPGLEQHPSNVFDTITQKWKLYGEGDEMKFDWADQNYKSKTYTVVAYKLGESFTLRTYANDSTKVFYTFSFIGKQSN